jgi:hypothetical protein
VSEQQPDAFDESDAFDEIVDAETTATPTWR